jgi:hypothetical protein
LDIPPTPRLIDNFTFNSVVAEPSIFRLRSSIYLYLSGSHYKPVKEKNKMELALESRQTILVSDALSTTKRNNKRKIT